MRRPICVEKNHGLTAVREVPRDPRAEHSGADYGDIVGLGDFLAPQRCTVVPASFAAQCERVFSEFMSVGSRCRGVMETSLAKIAA